MVAIGVTDQNNGYEISSLLLTSTSVDGVGLLSLAIVASPSSMAAIVSSKNGGSCNGTTNE